MFLCVCYLSGPTFRFVAQSSRRELVYVKPIALHALEYLCTETQAEQQKEQKFPPQR